MARPNILRLLRRYILSDVRRWARSLEHVRFCYSTSPHNDLDRELFEAVLIVPKSESEFLEMCSDLGIAVKRIQRGDKVARLGMKYSPAEWKQLIFPIPMFPNLAQPGDVTLAGVQVNVSVRDRFLTILIAPAEASTAYVDERDYQQARTVDALLNRPGLQFRNPPRDDGSCVCPTHYPQYWK